MNFIQPWMLIALPLIALPILIHLINQWRYQTKRWGAMMFLLAANRMNRGFARIRQWLILAMRTLAVAGLIFAVARPLASGFWAWSGAGRADTTIVLLDRSPSMQLQSSGGESKLETGRRQLADALRTLGSNHWVSIDSSTGQPLTFDSLDALMDAPALRPSDAATDLPALLQSTLDYLQANRPGPTEIWLCSDLQAADWKSDSGAWSLLREGFAKLPQSTRFHLLAYPEPPRENLAVRVTDVKRATPIEGEMADNALLLSLQISRTSRVQDDQLPVVEVPVQIEIEGARSEMRVELSGRQTEIRNHRVPLASNQVRGWGVVSLPADESSADNVYYFVFDEPQIPRIVIVSDDRTASRPLEVASAVSTDGRTESEVEVLSPELLDSLVLDETALLLWQAELPDASITPAIENYIATGGQVLFFPPASLQEGASVIDRQFQGVAWSEWVPPSDARVMVENWRGDADLLAATASGAGLPVGQLEIGGYARLRTEAEVSRLATLSGGAPLLLRIPSSRGGVYFCTVSPAPRYSSLAEAGIVLYVIVQRAIERGQQALGNATQRVAGEAQADSSEWRQLAGSADGLSVNFNMLAGIYQSGDRLFAINRPVTEDQAERLSDERVESLFSGLPFSQVDDRAGSLSGIVREIWRLFLILMIVALLAEAVLCLPHTSRAPKAAAV